MAEPQVEPTDQALGQQYYSRLDTAAQGLRSSFAWPEHLI